MSDGLKRITTIIIISAAAQWGAPVVLADADRPAAGAYEITTATTYTDVPMPDTTITTTSCLSAAALERDPASALASLPNSESCSVAEFVMEDGAIEMRIICDTTDGSMVMVTKGTYHSAGWDMVSDVTVTVGSDQVKMHATVEGRRMGDC